MAIPDSREHLPDTHSNPAWRRVDVGLSLLLAALVGLVWLYFTG